MAPEKLADYCLVIIIALGVSGILTFCGHVIYEKDKSNSEVDFCFIQRFSEGETTQFALKGHIPWATDLYLSKHPSMEEAIKQAEILKCPILHK